MELKIKEKVIEQTIYVTDDGAEFTDKREAEVWESKLKFDAEIQPKMYKYEDDEYYIVNSVDEFIILKTFIYEQQGYCFDYGFDEESIKYPVMLKYDNDSQVTIFDDEIYNHCLQLCKMYESLKSV